jgi:hypothetical protein
MEKQFVCPRLKGGLGNQMFMIASAYAYGAEHKLTMILCEEQVEENTRKHSTVDYFSTIFKNIARKNKVCIANTVILVDYMQDYQLFEQYYASVCQLFYIPEFQNTDLDLQDMCFIHFRNGDFREPGIAAIHHVLDCNSMYYANCLSHAKLVFPRIQFLVISDDLELCKNEFSHLWNSFPDTQFHFFDKPLNELETLSLMCSCGLGGIGANSTFSWWGLYLNRDRPLLMLPKTYFATETLNHMGYHFPGSIIKDV